MKTLFVLELFYPNVGGNEKLFLGIGQELVKHGHEVTVITTKFKRDLPARERFNDIRIIRVPLRNRYFFTFFGIFWIFRHAGAADLIHTTSYNAAFPAWLAGKLRGKPVVITFHEVWGKLWFSLPFLRFPGRLLFYIYEQFILRLDFTAFVAVSAYTRDCLVRHHVRPGRIRMIYNGLDVSEFTAPAIWQKSGSTPFTYAYFGRLGPSKGINILMEASVEFLKAGNRRFLLIASKKPSRIQRYISKMSRDHGLSHFIDWMDHLPEDKLKEVLAGVDCIVVPSYSEGFCFVAAEAAAMEVPLISSDRGALPEVVSGQHLFFHNLDADDLLKALESAEMGKWEHLPQKRFLLEDCVRHYLDLYSSMTTVSSS